MGVHHYFCHGAMQLDLTVDEVLTPILNVPADDVADVVTAALNGTVVVHDICSNEGGDSASISAPDTLVYACINHLFCYATHCANSTKKNIF